MERQVFSRAALEDAAHPDRMRAIKYTLLILLILAAGIYIASFGSGGVIYAQVEGGQRPSVIDNAIAALTPTPPAPPAAPPEPTKEEKQRAAIDEYFSGPIRTLHIEIDKDQADRLRRDERNYAEARVKEGDRLYKGVAIKLKGSAGSFQGLDAKPGMTLNFDKLKGAKRFYGMKKLHLNNCAQDATYLNELIAGEMSRKAGVPASRCTHVFLRLNERDLGLYVLKEAFTTDFLSAFFEDPTGDLYDGGFVRDIGEDSEKDEGDPKDIAALKELIAASQEGDNAKRWERLGKILDLDQYMSFLAMESLLGHWDGYSFNRNNYRFYQDPTSKKFVFFLHGMDQTFQDAGFPIQRDPVSLVSGAVMRCPEAKPLYLERVAKLYEKVFQGTDWGARILAVGEKVRAAIAAKEPPKTDQMAKDFENRIKEANDRITRRITEAGKQLAAIPKPVIFGKDGVMKVPKEWRQDGGGAQLAETQVDGQNCLHIRASGQSSASWRKTVSVPPGRYRFEAQARTAGVSAENGQGAGLRLSGGARTPQSTATGDAPWKKLEVAFETPGGDVLLVAELRGDKGEVWFQNESLQLVQVK